MCDAFPQHSRFLAERLRHFEAQLATAIRRNFSSLSCAPPVWHVRLQLCSNHSTVAELAGDGLHAAHQFKALLLVKAFRKERRRSCLNVAGLPLIPWRHQFSQVWERREDPQLLDLVRSLPGSCMQLFLSFNDWTVTHTRAMQALLPLGEMCTVPSATGGIPVPDWTFTEYPNINAKWEGTKDSSWEQMWPTLQHQFEHQTVNDRDEVVRWRGRKSQPVFWLAAPLEYRIRRSIAGTYFLKNNDSLAALGLRNDVKIEKDRLSWRDMCRARYQLHVDGYTNAYSLKYRLACGGTVLRIQGGNWVGRHIEIPIEWWEAVTPLVAGVHYISVHANFSNLISQLERTSRRASWSIAKNAAKYARTHLSPTSVECYQRAFLSSYAQLYRKWASFCSIGEKIEDRFTCREIQKNIYDCSNEPRRGFHNRSSSHNGRPRTTLQGRIQSRSLSR